jgi:Glycosyl transferases group 1
MFKILSGIFSAQLQQTIALSRQKNAQTAKWNKASALKVLLITEKSRIPQSQIFPFYYYAHQIHGRWNTEFKEINIDHLEPINAPLVKHADRIFIQPWFVKGEKKIVQILEKLKKLNPNAKIAFFDSNAPTDMRLAETVNPYIDFYVKKHVLADLHAYGKMTEGDHQLIQYYNRLFKQPAAKPVAFAVSQNFLDKLIVGPSYFMAQEMLPFFDRLEAPWPAKKTINLHVRFKTKGSSWFNLMREHAMKSCMDIPFDAMVISDASIDNRQYQKELRASRACLSPFGYGEICWRDFEAILAGALLIKPDVSHIETQPGVFLPFKTYVPVKWDFSDLEEKITYYLDNEDLASNIALNAFKAVHEYAHEEGFIQQYARLFD